MNDTNRPPGPGVRSWPSTGPLAGRSSVRIAATLILAALLTATASVAVPTPAGAASNAFTASVVAADAGTFTSTLFPAANAFPDGSGSQRAVARDCGFSTGLPGAKSLWVFCDTATFDGLTGTGPDRTGTLRFTPSATAALAPTTAPTAEAPVSLREAVHPAIDRAFLGSGSTYGSPAKPIACPGGGTAFAWTTGLVTLPGTSTAVDFFQDHCPEVSAGYPEYDMGVAEYTAPSATGDYSGSTSLTATARYDSVLLNPTPGAVSSWSYGYGAVADATYIYVYGSRAARYDCTATCTLTMPGSVTVARVRWANGEYRSGKNYQYYTGRTGTLWSSDRASAAELLDDQQWPSGDGLSVGWYPQIGRYVMAHGNSTIAPGTGAALRTAPTPWGPWSPPIDVAVSAASSYARPGGSCSAPTTCRTFLLHPDLTAGGNLYLSYVRENDWADRDGTLVTLNGMSMMRVRLASVPLAALPVPPPETALVTVPTDPSASTSATFTFVSPGRAATAGDPSPLPYATPRPLTFQCALDGAAPTTCTNPTVVASLAPGRHTFTVRAVNADGLADPTPSSWTWWVDTAAPRTTLSSGPASPSDPAGSTFTFSGTDDQTAASALAFRCSIDSAAPVACKSPWTATQATSGTHTVTVAAVDRAGNTDPVPPRWTWNVDTDPAFTVTQAPPAFTNRATETIAFTVADDHAPAGSLQPRCSLDGRAYAACTSPLTLTGLGTGPHVLSLRATDDRGNIGARDIAWTVDTVAPVARVVSDAVGAVPRTSATMILSASDDRAGAALMQFRCGLDGAPATPCSSPVAFTDLAPGAHAVTVTATDPAGNQSAAVVARWTVDVAAPTTTVDSGPPASTTSSTVTFAFHAVDDQTANGALGLVCRLDGAEPALCTSPMTVVGLEPGDHTMDFASADAAGNWSAVVSRSWTMPFVFTGDAPSAAFTGVAYSYDFTTNAPPDDPSSSSGPSVTYAVTSGTLPPGIRLDARGHLAGTSQQAGDAGPVTVTASAAWGTVTRTFSLPVQGTQSITGRVTNRATGAPAAAVRVRAFTTGGLLMATTSTGDDGTYHLGYLRPASYKLCFVDPTGNNWVTTYSGGASSLTAAAPVVVADGATTTADAAVEPLNTVGGTLTDSRTGAALAGRSVTAFDPAGVIVTFTSTATDGSWSLGRLRSGTYRLRFSDPAGAYVLGYYAGATSLATATPVVLTTGAPARADDTLDPYTIARGRVTDEVTGQAIAGANVTLADSAGTPIALAYSDATGAYSFGGLRLGSYSLTFGDPTGAHFAESAVGFEAGGGVVTVDRALEPTGSIVGTVSDKVTGQRVAGARVTIFDAGGATLAMVNAAADGSYAFSRLHVGSYRLKIDDPSGAHTSQYWPDRAALAAATPVVLAGGTVGIDVTLVPLGTVGGRVVDASGTAVAGGWVTLYRSDGTPTLLVATGADGTYRFTRLALGTYRLGFSDPKARFTTEYWRDATSLSSASPVAVTTADPSTADFQVAPRS